jgi:RNA polymerase sigma-70 factor (ECF subfamily)
VDEPEFREFYLSHAARVLAFTRRWGVSAADAEDVVADVFLVAWRRRDQLPDEPIGWLLGVTRRVLANHHRGQERRGALLDRLAVGSVPLDAAAGAARGADHAILRALGSLRAQERELLELLAWDGLSRAQLAEVFGVSRGTIAVRIHRARLKLRRALANPSASAAVAAGAPSQLEESGHA